MSPTRTANAVLQLLQSRAHAIETLAMATAFLRRFPTQIARSGAIIRSSSSVSSCPNASAKVSDRIVKLSAIDADGNKRDVIGLTGHTLLRALANAGLIDPASHRMEEIDACSAECEVHIAQEWLDKLPPLSYDERYVLTRSSRNRVLNKHARLGCQVVLNHDLQGMVVAVPEAKPWDIP